jgi:hypothetical protein
MYKLGFALALVLAAGCDAGEIAGDPQATDAHPVGDGHHGDDAPDDDARVPDAEPGSPPDAGPYQCQTLDLTPAQTCDVALTGEVQACSIDPDGTPSLRGWMEVRRPDGTNGYLCAVGYDPTGGYYLASDRVHLGDSASACCDGTTGATLDWPAADGYFGVPHGPTHVKPWEMATTTGGEIRENPFAVIVSSPAAAATYQDQHALWQSWAGDGQPHTGPDGTGHYYFPAFIAVNYVVVPTINGDPVIVIGPEPSTNSSLTKPVGHPTLGACAGHGGSPLAFIAGDIQGTTLTNHSGRFGHDPNITADDLDNAARLFNCYGITITDVVFTPPDQ